jgi:hypothetical protein
MRYATLWFMTPFLTASGVTSLRAIVGDRDPEPARPMPTLSIKPSAPSARLASKPSSRVGRTS